MPTSPLYLHPTEPAPEAVLRVDRALAALRVLKAETKLDFTPESWSGKTVRMYLDTVETQLRGARAVLLAGKEGE